VRHTQEDKPVEIGLLQRHATDALMAKPGAPLFSRAAPSGKRVAVVGAGPAGLACAHRLAMLGHDVVLYDAQPKLGGLNEYGIASYKTVDGFAQKEVDWLLSIGGIEVKPGHRLGRDMQLDALAHDHDAVFLGLGLGGVNSLGIDEPLPVRAAVDFIAELRQAASPAAVPVGRRVLVIGGGMTAVDAAVQSRLLGAEEATIVYRRGPEAMSASAYEQQWAQTHGVLIRHWAAPQQLLVERGQLRGLRFVRTRLEGGRLLQDGESFDLAADVVLKAIGQTLVPDALGPGLRLQDGRIATDADGKTSHPKVWAGGDCRAGGRDLTVEAVQHGKVAAIAIDRELRA
jgi:glutamate synthase (NADPH/NADH) small chain